MVFHGFPMVNPLSRNHWLNRPLHPLRFAPRGEARADRGADSGANGGSSRFLHLGHVTVWRLLRVKLWRSVKIYPVLYVYIYICIYKSLPSGKLSHNELERSTMLSMGKIRVNPHISTISTGPCSIANCNKIPEGIIKSINIQFFTTWHSFNGGWTFPFSSVIALRFAHIFWRRPRRVASLNPENLHSNRNPHNGHVQQQSVLYNTDIYL